MPHKKTHSGNDRHCAISFREISHQTCEYPNKKVTRSLMHAKFLYFCLSFHHLDIRTFRYTSGGAFIQCLVSERVSRRDPSDPARSRTFSRHSWLDHRFFQRVEECRLRSCPSSRERTAFHPRCDLNERFSCRRCPTI